MSKLIIISGPSGVGKGTIIELLKKRYLKENKKLYLSISCTTRSPREGEIDGVHYYFISEDEFLERIKRNDFLEYNKYGTGKYYGTPKSTVMDYLKQDYDVILEIDINGYKRIKKECPNCIGIFIMPPNEEELYQRLKNRGTEDEKTIQIRLATAQSELKQKDIYDYLVVNYDGKVEKSSEEVYNIINKS